MKALAAEEMYLASALLSQKGHAEEGHSKMIAQYLDPV